MLCQQCRKHAATVFVRTVINGRQAEMHLCETCAREKEAEFNLVEPKLAIQNFLAGLMESGGPAVVGTGSAAAKCANCRMTFAEFSRTGRLGCGHCYTQFSQGLEPLLRRIHGSNYHTGKVPQHGGAAARARQEMADLRNQLTEAIRREEFERAASIRDRIRLLEKDLR